jgi:hypothetical protein
MMLGSEILKLLAKSLLIKLPKKMAKKLVEEKKVNDLLSK